MNVKEITDRVTDINNAVTAWRIAPIRNLKQESFSTGTYTFKRWCTMLFFMQTNSQDEFCNLFDLEGMPTIPDTLELSIETIPEFNTVKIYFPDNTHLELFGIDNDLFYDLEAFASLDI